MIRPAPFVAAIVLTMIAPGSPPSARAEMPPQPNEQATLVVEGVVRESYQSIRSTRVDFLFEIEVRSARMGSAPSAPFDGALPRPGDLVHVAAFQRRADAPRVPGPGGYPTLPGEQDVIRAYLYPRNGGVGWQFAYPLGFERLGRAGSTFGPEPSDGPPDLGAGTGTGGPRRIGVLVMPASSGNRPGLQVTSVTPGTPAHRAGLEPGDLILEADGAPTRTLADLASQVARAGGRLRLVIRNIRTGLLQPLDVELSP